MARAVRPDDPGRSWWWTLLAVVIGIATGVVTHLAGLGNPWPLVAGVMTAVLGVIAAIMKPVRELVSDRSRSRTAARHSGALGTVADATRTTADLMRSRVHASDRDISEFCPRDLAPTVHDRLVEGHPVLVEGPSMAGKTRLVLEVLKESWPEKPLWLPAGDDGIRTLLASGQTPTKDCVVFLDDVDRFLSNQSLTLDLLTRWERDGCTVVATITRSKYAQFRDSAESKLPGWDVVNRFTRLQLDPLLSQHELAALRATSYAPLTGSISAVGLAPFLGGAPQARERFQEDRGAHRWSAALVMAAADWRRVGLGPASKEQIVTLAENYRGEAWGEPDWSQTWADATRPFNHTVSLLREIGDDEWEVLDLISDEADWILSQGSFDAMADVITTTRQALTLTLTMHGSSKLKTSQHADQLIKKAASWFDETIGSNPSNANILGGYALFLTGVRGDHDQAEKYFRRSLDADPNDTQILGRYAILLTDIRGDYDQAQNYYERALDADPDNAWILGRYAILLTAVRGDYDQAEKYFRRALAADPNNAWTLGNYANFLTDIRGDHDQAQECYERTLDADPNNAPTLGGYALFLTAFRGDHDQAEKYFRRALDADPNDTQILGSYALFLTDIRGDHDQAQAHYERALDADPNNAWNLSNYAQLLFITRKDEQATALAERALALAGPDEEPLLAECHTYLFMHSPTHRGTSGQAFKTLLARGVTTGSWSFEGNLDRLRTEGDLRLGIAEALVSALRDGDTTELETFPEWREL